MVEKTKKLIRIDLNQFKLHLNLKTESELTLHFDSPSRRFYLSVIGLVVNEMKKRGRITSISLGDHLDVLVLLNETVGAKAGSSKKEYLIPRIYRKWKDALPDLENAPLFRIAGKKKQYDESMDKVYGFSEVEKDRWANLFEYKGSHEQVRLTFSLDRLDASLDNVAILYTDSSNLANVNPWDAFVAGLKDKLDDKSIPGKEPYQKREAESLPLQLGKRTQVKQNRFRWALLFVSIAIVLVATALVLWTIFSPSPHIEVASLERMAFSLPDKPSIAVLPFRNLSDDPKQEYFSDGLAEDIITGLSKVPKLFVIARNSTFTYKGKNVKIRQVSEELGVRYVLEGSVRKVDNRLRITAQLIDAIKGHHLWAERFDREFKDIFAIQDEITIKILTALRIQLADARVARLHERSTDNLQAYLKLCEGLGYLYEVKYGDAIRSFKEARSLDPLCSMAYAYEAYSQVSNYFRGPNSIRAQSLKKAFEAGKKCEELADDVAECSPAMGLVYLARREYDKAVFEGKRGVDAYPNSPIAARIFGWILRAVGKHVESIEQLERALRLDPINPQSPLVLISASYLAMGRYEDAIETCWKALEHSPNHLGAYLVLAAAYSTKGDMDKARAAASKIMEINPNFSAKHFMRSWPYKDEAYKNFILNHLLKAGLK